MFNYQKDSSDQLLEQIQEKVNSLELFFPQGKTDITMAAYNKNIINKGLNEITKNAIKISVIKIR